MGGKEIENKQWGNDAYASNEGVEYRRDIGKNARHHAIFHGKENDAHTYYRHKGFAECRRKELSCDTEEDGMGNKGEIRDYRYIYKHRCYAETQRDTLAITQCTPLA